MPELSAALVAVPPFFPFAVICAWESFALQPVEMHQRNVLTWRVARPLLRPLLSIARSIPPCLGFGRAIRAEQLLSVSWYSVQWVGIGSVCLGPLASFLLGNEDSRNR